MCPHHEVAELKPHEHIVHWNPVQAWVERILSSKNVGPVALMAGTSLLYLVVFLSLFSGMDARTVTGF